MFWLRRGIYLLHFDETTERGTALVNGYPLEVARVGRAWFTGRANRLPASLSRELAWAYKDWRKAQ